MIVGLALRIVGNREKFPINCSEISLKKIRFSPRFLVKTNTMVECELSINLRVIWKQLKWWWQRRASRVNQSYVVLSN